jgi:hypothetical protein
MVKFTATIDKFAHEFGVKDHPDMSDGEVETLKINHFYYIDEDMQGWYINNYLKLDNMFNRCQLEHAYAKREI